MLLRAGEDLGRWSHLIEKFENTIHTHEICVPYRTLFFFILSCLDAYMQSNAWQGSYVRSPAIKKAQGAKGEGEESRWKRRRGRVAAERASVFPQERSCRAKSTWKSRGMGKWCRERRDRALAELPNSPVCSTRLGSVVLTLIQLTHHSCFVILFHFITGS